MTLAKNSQDSSFGGERNLAKNQALESFGGTPKPAFSPQRTPFSAYRTDVTEILQQSHKVATGCRHERKSMDW